jgi:hypothetical protein
MSKQIYIDFIISELEKDNVKYNDVLSLFVTKFNLTDRTFARHWKTATEYFYEQRKQLKETVLSETMEIEKEVVKTIISNKLERLEIYHNQIINCIKELNHGFTEDMKGGELFSRPLTISEKALLRKTIKDLQSEISKIEGDYATSKLEMSFNVGLDMEEEFQ